MLYKKSNSLKVAFFYFIIFWFVFLKMNNEIKITTITTKISDSIGKPGGGGAAAGAGGPPPGPA